jgi:basic amino acid/polyamine antiporter, APA family
MASKTRQISRHTATNIVVANMIGTGVFTSLGFQIAALRSDIAILALWVVGGLLALCGSLCYAELAAALPRSGGEYHFLSRIYHPAVGFMAGWVSATVGFAAPVALSAMAFGSYLQPVLPGFSPTVLALIVVWAITLIQLSGVRVGELFQNSTTILKVVLIIALIAAGLCLGHGHPLATTSSKEVISSLFSGPFAVSLVYVMYSYSGWNAATYITDEVKEPARNVPWALAVGTVSVAVVYLLLNYTFLITTGRSVLSGELQVGLLSGQAIFGDAGGKIVSLLIGIGLIASVSAMTWIGPRVTKRMAEDLSALGIFGHSLPNGIPYVALLFQLAVTTLLILTKKFEPILIYIQFSLLLCSFLAVLGVLILRWKEPELPRPYRVWAYPFPPIFFLLVTLHMMIYVMHDKPRESLLGFATMIAGLAVYFAFRRRPATASHTLERGRQG